MKNKKPGIERPYTFLDFLFVIEALAKEKNVEYLDQLDYFSVGEKDEVIKSSDFNVRSETSFGGSEGIYTTFTIRTESTQRRLFVAKTLRDSDEDFIKMHVFGAQICLLIKKFRREHDDEFNWEGYDVGYIEDGKTVPCWWCRRKENALARAAEIKASGNKPVIRDNATRKIIEQ